MDEYTVRPFLAADGACFPEFADLGIKTEFVPSPAYTGLCDGVPIVCAGVIPGNLLYLVPSLAPLFTYLLVPRIPEEPFRDGMGEGWACLRKPVLHARWIARTVRMMTDRLMDSQFDRLEAPISPEKAIQCRFLEFLGFRIDERFGDRGHVTRGHEDVLMYARVRA